MARILAGNRRLPQKSASFYSQPEAIGNTPPYDFRVDLFYQFHTLRSASRRFLFLGMQRTSVAGTPYFDAALRFSAISF